MTVLGKTLVFFNLLFIFAMFGVGLSFRDNPPTTKASMQHGAPQMPRFGLPAAAAAVLALIATGPARDP